LASQQRPLTLLGRHPAIHILLNTQTEGGRQRRRRMNTLLGPFTRNWLSNQETGRLAGTGLRVMGPIGMEVGTANNLVAAPNIGVSRACLEGHLKGCLFE
jgi:hypothetical protein